MDQATAKLRERKREGSEKPISVNAGAFYFHYHPRWVEENSTIFLLFLGSLSSSTQSTEERKERRRRQSLPRKKYPHIEKEERKHKSETFPRKLLLSSFTFGFSLFLYFLLFRMTFKSRLCRAPCRSQQQLLSVKEKRTRGILLSAKMTSSLFLKLPLLRNVSPLSIVFTKVSLMARQPGSLTAQLICNIFK